MADSSMVGLVALLRGSGMKVPVGAVIAFAEAVALLGSDLHSIYWAGRTTMTTSPVDIEVFDLVFRHWILGTRAQSEPFVVNAVESKLADDEELGAEQADTSDRQPGDMGVLRFSRTETLRTMDFASLDDGERAESDRLISEMRLSVSRRQARRRRSTHRSSGDLDVRSTVRASLRTGGEPLRLRHSSRTLIERRVVILADISGSMSDYSRALLRFAHAAVAARATVEAFALGTRLTRLTRQLTTRDPDRALAFAAASVVDWSGGTRLGEGLRQFNDDWGVKGMARGADIVILSDGWDRGEVEELAVQMERLSYVAHRIVWVNPLKATDGYAPLARGMAAALPHVDEFIEGHSLEALDRLSEIISSDRPRPVRSSGR